eukprot:jgi/Botrbrau1/19346/Bobra.0073s0071.1
MYVGRSYTLRCLPPACWLRTSFYPSHLSFNITQKVRSIRNATCPGMVSTSDICAVALYQQPAHLQAAGCNLLSKVTWINVRYNLSPAKGRCAAGILADQGTFAESLNFYNPAASNCSP